MRNLKRALSLTLASVMLLGMMIVGTSAASYPDVDENDNVEAIEVLNAVGVMIGDNGNFKPDAPVTRNEMAVIMAKLILGTYAADSYVGTHPFTDVPTWADRYVAACYASGIVAGRSATTYDGQATVTAVEAAAMMLRALGYEDLSKNATRWDQPVAAKANEIALFTGMSGASNAAMNRDSVAKLALNALQATMVTTTRTSSDIQIGDVSIAGNLRYDDRYTSTLDYTKSNGKFVASGVTASTDDKLQLCEYLYGTDLRKIAGQSDDMLRPATQWVYKSEDVIKVADAANHTFVAKNTKNYFALVKEINGRYNTSSATVNINGAADSGDAAAKVGDVVEVYMSDTTPNAVAQIVVTQYKAAKIDSAVQTRTSDGKDYVRVPGVLNAYTEIDDVTGYADLAKDDVVYYVTTANGKTQIHKADSFQGQLTSYQQNSGTTPAKYTISGTQYLKNGNISTVAGLTGALVYNTTYEYYTDPNGYIIYGKAVEDELSDYVVIQSLGTRSGGVDATTLEARLVKMDGTTQVVTISKLNDGTNTYTATGATATTGLFYENPSRVNGINDTIDGYVDKMFFTYKTDSNGKYELKAVSGTGLAQGNATGVTVTNGSVKIGSTTVNDSTIFVVAKEDNGDSFTAYTGKGAVPTMTTANYAYVTKDGVATYIYVDTFATKTSSGDAIYFLQDYNDTKIVYTTIKDGTNEYQVANIKAIVNGQVTTVQVAATGDAVDTTEVTNYAQIAVGKLVDPTYNDKKVITEVSTGDTAAKPAENGYELVNGALKIVSDATLGYLCDESTPLYYKDNNGDIHPDVFGDHMSDKNDKIYVVVKDDGKAAGQKVVDYAYVEDVADQSLATLTVNGTDSTARTVSKIEAVNNLTGDAGVTYTVTATATGAEDISYSVTNATSGFGTAPGNKQVTAVAGSTVTVWVKVTSKADTNVSAVYTVNISAPAVATAAKLEVVVSYTKSSVAVTTPGWATSDKVVITSAGGTTNLNVTATATKAAGTGVVTWGVTGTPTGYTATFDGSKLTLTASATGAVAATSPFGTVSVAPTVADSSVDAAAGAATWTNGTNA